MRMRRLPRPLAIPLAGLVCGAIGAAVFSVLGGVVAGEDSCSDVVFSGNDATGSLANAMFIGVFGAVAGLVVGALIAGVGVVLSARHNLMVVETGLIAVVAAGGGPFQLLGSVSLNSGIDHERCISGALLGGFVGAALGMLVGIQEFVLPALAQLVCRPGRDIGGYGVAALEVRRVDALG